jgi:hypothetical protein
VVTIVAALVVFSYLGDSLVLLARIGGVILLLFGVVTPVLGVRQAKQEPGGRPHLSAAH